MEQRTRICRKCLLRDAPEEETWKNVREYVERLPEEDRVDEQVYENRLLICRSCDQLLGGVCRKCGCFVEMRAAMKLRSCPDVSAKWGRER